MYPVVSGLELWDVMDVPVFYLFRGKMIKFCCGSYIKQLAMTKVELKTQRWIIVLL